MNEISIMDLKNINNPNIIDVRDNYNYNLGHMNNAKNIPYYGLLSNHSVYLNKNEIYYFYCDYGKKSKEISNYLNSLGYNTFYVKEGYLDFQKKLK